jgi:hypothetical protein
LKYMNLKVWMYIHMCICVLIRIYLHACVRKYVLMYTWIYIYTKF